MVSEEQKDGFGVYLTNESKGMVGDVLTTLEVLGLTPSQSEAIKSLLKQRMWAHHTRVWQFFCDHIAHPDSKEL